MTVEITQPYPGTARFKFSTGLRVDISDRTEEGGKIQLYINCAGHDEDGGHETIFIRPEASNSLTLFFHTFQLQESISPIK